MKKYQSNSLSSSDARAKTSSIEESASGGGFKLMTSGSILKCCIAASKRRIFGYAFTQITSDRSRFK